ncbi:histidine--tRNA ligase [Methanogenium cariaci]|jgi:histidyl-tRNA synthetase
MIQRPRGTRDFLPDEMEFRRNTEKKMREAARRWGYREVCTPTFETQELYTIRSGEGIIHEMYTFEDKGGRALALRPEGTAAVLRMYVNEAKMLAKPLRWCYLSDCYRYERPQKGRYRQFWQFGAELIGADTPEGDAEAILLADDILRAAGVTYDLHVGHLSPMRAILRDLPEDRKRTIMALLDKKNIEGLEETLDSWHLEDLESSLKGLLEADTTDEVFAITGPIPEQERIESVVNVLENEGTVFRQNYGIVRGLDYYTGMVFEGFADNLGAENQIIGGGAYRLAHLFGGDDVGSCGFGIGFDRVMVSLGEVPTPEDTVIAVLYTKEAREYAFSISRQFRDAGFRTEINLLDRGIGAQMKHAAKKAHYAVLAGEREMAGGTVTLRNLTTGNQNECGVAEAIRGVSQEWQ